MQHSDFKGLLTRMVHLDASLARKPWAVVMVVVLALTLTIAMTILLASKYEVISPDTREYLAFSRLRVFGYPTFLAMVSAVANFNQGVIIAQTAIFLAASIFLSFVMLNATCSLILTLGLVLLLIGNNGVTVYNLVAITESLTTSLTMIALAALIQFHRTHNLRWFVLLCVVAGLNIVLKPAGQVYLPFLILLIIYAWVALRTDMRRMAATFALTVAFSYGSIIAANYVLHGFAGINSNHGSGLLGKAILMAPKHENNFDGTPLNETVREISTLLTPVVTKLDQLEDTRARILASQAYVDYLRFGVLFPTYRERYGHTDSWDRELYVRDIASAIVAKDPVSYLQLAWREFTALAILAPIMTPREVARTRADVERLAPWPYYGDEVMEIETAFPRLLKMQIDVGKSQRSTATVVTLRIIYYGFYVIGAGSVLMMLVKVAQRKPISWEIQIVGSAAVLYFGTVTLTALGDIGIMRYVAPIWPCIAVSWICAGHWVWKAVSHSDEIIESGVVSHCAKVPTG